jgi:hypothetical protein
MSNGTRTAIGTGAARGIGAAVSHVVDELGAPTVRRTESTDSQ